MQGHIVHLYFLSTPIVMQLIDFFCLVQVIESNLSTIQVLQPLAEEIQVLMDQDSSPAWHYRLDPQTLSAVHLKAISRIYGLLSIHCNRHISPRHFQHICVV